ICAHPDTPSYKVTFRYLQPGGDGEVWLEQIAVAQFNSAGKPVRIHGLTTDITERKRFEQEISRARKSAELADRAKSSFVSAASHDLRQPLQTLRFLQGSARRRQRSRSLRVVHLRGLGESPPRTVACFGLTVVLLSIRGKRRSVFREYSHS